MRLEPKTNILTVTASQEIIKRVKEELSKIDVPPRQVMVEALVTELTKDARKSLGIDASWLGIKDGRNLSVILPTGNLLDSTLGSSTLGIIYSRPESKFEGWLGMFSTTLKALVQNGKANI
ncbi:MAG: hypothetical protein ABII96_00905 [Candidatus Zixiibacteriota bacterium]